MIVCKSGALMFVLQCQGGKTSTTTLNCINLESVIGFIVLQIVQKNKILFTKTFMTVFSLPRRIQNIGQVVQCSKKRQKTQELHLRQVLGDMLNVHDSAIRKRLNNYGLFGRVARKRLFLSEIWQHSFGLQSCNLEHHKTSGTMSFRQTRPK